LYEFKKTLNITNEAYVVNGAYVGIGTSYGDSMQVPNRDQAIAVIREFLAGNAAAVRQSAKDASTAVSTIQIFADAIRNIAKKLAKMSKLANNASDPDYSLIRIEEMQTQFQNLAKEVNQIVNSTEYNFNKPFSGNGKTLSIHIGNGSKIDIFAMDFRFDAQDLNVVTDSQNVLSIVNKAITKVNEYKRYLDKQTSHLGDLTATMESEIEGAMNVNMKDFQPKLAVPMAGCTASLISQDKQTSLNTQANLAPNETLKLFKINY